MSTRCSFGYQKDDPSPPEQYYHLFTDFLDKGFVFLELPRDALNELDQQFVTLKLTPEMWNMIRQHAAPK